MTEGPSSANTVDDVPSDHESFAAVAELCERLAAEFPEVPQPRIEALLMAAFARTADANVGTFRLVFAERSTRARLMAEADG